MSPKRRNPFDLCRKLLAVADNPESTAALLGLEPTGEFYRTDEAASTSENCRECRAALALHSACTRWLDLSSIDADLLSVVLAWENISERIRAGIVVLAALQE
jgi:hypothetical protein